MLTLIDFSFHSSRNNTMYRVVQNYPFQNVMFNLNVFHTTQHFNLKKVIQNESTEVQKYLGYDVPLYAITQTLF